ncbi:MAG: PQQ-binding-like beta-propeller repeat protein [Planctomycetes bacterium]|nr:PQQ-binding-like beta-propeller repeat protein [Planctomycetota bacterium]
MNFTCRFVAMSIFGLAIPGLAGEPAAESDWPQWRGLKRDGVWRSVRLPEKLIRAAVEERWRVPLGGGYSGIAVAGRRVFTMDRPKASAQTERIVCLDRESGRTLWAREYPASSFARNDAEMVCIRIKD